MQDGGLEDLLVILADKRWKGKRVDLLEERMTRLLTDEALQPFFEVFLTVSNVAETLAQDADARMVEDARANPVGLVEDVGLAATEAPRSATEALAETLARDADARLAWQNAFGASVSG